MGGVPGRDTEGLTAPASHHGRLHEGSKAVDAVKQQLLIVFAGFAWIYGVIVARRHKQTAAGEHSGCPAA